MCVGVLINGEYYEVSFVCVCVVDVGCFGEYCVFVWCVVCLVFIVCVVWVCMVVVLFVWCCEMEFGWFVIVVDLLFLWV